MATQFSIDDAFVLEGDEEGAVSDGEAEGWGGRDREREAGEMTFGPLSFSKPQTHPSPAATGSPEHSNLKYQVHTQAQTSSWELFVRKYNLSPCAISLESGKWRRLGQQWQLLFQ